MKILYIEWVDSSSVALHWRPIADIQKDSAADCIIQSIGFLIAESTTTITLANSLDTTAFSSATLCIQIPKVAIKKRRVIHLP